MGLGTLVVRNIARDPECKNETLGIAFGLQFTGGCITLLLTVMRDCATQAQRHLTRWLVGIIAAGTIFNAFEGYQFLVPVPNPVKIYSVG